MHDLFIKQVLRTPDAIALIDDEGKLSYIELFALVSALHQRLLSEHIQLQEPVIVRIPKGRWQLVATTAIMMAGGAYLPLETSWPQERCTKVIRKSGCRLALVIDSKDVPEGIAHINISEQSLQCSEPQATAVAFTSVQKPSDLAYIIFTSGSTGEPKGVAIEHRSAVNTLLDINNKYEVTANDRILAVSALSFDLSVYDLFGLLACGGCIVFPSHEKAMDPTHWAQLIEQHQVTLWDTVPASVELLVEQFDFLGRSSTAPIRNVMMSGDWIDPALPRRIWNTFKGANAISMGGATEGSIWSIFYRITQDTSGWKSVPYGKPLANQSFHILNDNLQQVPPGVVGELFIGGVGVAREYYGDPELSAYRYIYHKGLGQRLYRTGDMGRYMTDGNIEFMGRVDDQVKINGFRIETGEIEQQLSALDDVYTCLVTVNKLESGMTSLVAYLQLNKHSNFDESNITEHVREQLSANLPAYMIPQFVLLIEKWPLTANGKVDKKSLPKPDVTSLLTPYEAPETVLEKQITEIWAQLLKLDLSTIGVNNNFMELGGNSLLVIRMTAKIEQQIGAKLELRQVYEHPTIRRLCKLLDINRKQQSIAEQLNDLDDDGIEEVSL
nr:non-ribosomal peptide synthetase [Pseudoalteromonas sp. OANN1]